MKREGERDDEREGKGREMEKGDGDRRGERWGEVGRGR